MSNYEKNYIAGRQDKTQEELFQYFKRNTIPDFDMARFIMNSSPVNIAIAISGGGYRSMLTGLGVLGAFDKTSPGALLPGNLGGILQSTSYIAGISGGSWLVMSNVISDSNNIYQLKQTDYKQYIPQRLLAGVPDFDPGYKGQNHLTIEKQLSKIDSLLHYLGFETESKVSKDPLIQIMSKIFASSNTSKMNPLEGFYQFYQSVHSEILQKKQAGSFVSFTDYWGRALNKRLFLKYTARTFSSVVDLPSMTTFSQPFPILAAIQKAPLKEESHIDSCLIEFSPVEFGSWDSCINGFVELEYLGSELENGVGITGCKKGYDDIGFLVATSSSLFNNVFAYIYNYLIDLQKETQQAFQTILLLFGLSSNSSEQGLPHQHPDYAIYSPNPFYKYNYSSQHVSQSHHLYLVDGGNDGQNIPFHSLLQPARNIGVILAFDMSSEMFNFPNGSSLVKTGERFHNNANTLEVKSFSYFGNQLSLFPKVPQIEALKPLLNAPVFFGCDIISDYPRLTAKTELVSDYLPPLIVYTANREIVFASNTSTFKLSYSPQEIDSMFQNGYELATVSNSTDFAACLGCAMVKRNFDKSKAEIPDFCQKCFQQYCWHDTHNFANSSQISLY